MLASLCYSDTKDHKLFLRRMLALRIECWYEPKLRSIITQLLDWFLCEYSVELSRPPTGHGSDNLTLSQILGLKWSNKRISEHYRLAYV